MSTPNPSAFPTFDPNYEEKYSSPGMTLRDYFAARAAEYIQWNTGTTTLNAARCYEIADALLKARDA